VPHINLWDPCCFTKVPDGPQTYTFNVLWLQEERAQIHMSEWSQSFTLTKNVVRGFNLCSTPPTQWNVQQPYRVKMSPQGIMFSEKASNNLALCPIKGQKPSLCTQTRSRSSRACLWVPQRPCHHTQCWLTKQHLILLRISCLETSKASLGPTNFRAGPHLELIGDFLSSYSSMSRVPVQPHRIPGRESFNAFWHCWTNGDILTASRSFKAACLSEQIHTYFSGLFWNWIS